MSDNNIIQNYKMKLLEDLSCEVLISEEEKRSITDLAIFKTFPKGTILLKEGDYTNETYHVISGCIRSYMLIDGSDITTEFYTEFESFSPTCAVNNTPSNCFASSLEDTLVIVSTPEMEDELLSKIPALESLCRKSTERLIARQQQSFERFRSLTPEQRYLHLIETRPDLLQRVPQYHLASFLGIRPESLSRIRKRLAQK